VYHYHVQDSPPFTIGCFGPAYTSNGVPQSVTVEQCRELYDGCGDGDDLEIRWGPESGNSSMYDPWCPCFDQDGSNVANQPNHDAAAHAQVSGTYDAAAETAVHSCYFAKLGGQCSDPEVREACPVTCHDEVAETGVGQCVCDLTQRPDGSWAGCADFVHKCTGKPDDPDDVCWGTENPEARAGGGGDEHEHVVPGCGGAPMLDGRTGCDGECAGLAYVADMGVCSGCTTDGETPITSQNVGSLQPPAVLCPPDTGQGGR
jgi:hypothetical protein